jgi:hypothetical protein
MSDRRSHSTGRSIINTLGATAIAAVRVPLSGAVGDRFAGDIVRPLLSRDLCVGVKVRADGFRELYSARWSRRAYRQSGSAGAACCRQASSGGRVSKGRPA